MTWWQVETDTSQIDYLNDWVGSMDGNQQTETPNMDNFSDTGMVFGNAHCPAPLCSPSRQIKLYIQSYK